jgi:hypothetical protein
MDEPGGISLGKSAVCSIKYSPFWTGHWTVAFAFLLIIDPGNREQDSEKIGIGVVDSRLVAKIKLFGQQFDQAHFDGNIGICTFLNKTVSQECAPQSVGMLASMVSEV